jgi:hypothetical protein
MDIQEVRMALPSMEILLSASRQEQRTWLQRYLRAIIRYASEQGLTIEDTEFGMLVSIMGIPHGMSVYGTVAKLDEVLESGLVKPGSNEVAA